MWWLDYKTEFCNEPGYLRVTARGTYSLGRSSRLIARVARELRARAIARVLLDVTRVPNPVPDFERIELGRVSARAVAGFRIAVVDPTEARDKGIESVARNMGVAMRVFDAEPEAVAWLLDE